jgi:hypothetical protein
MMHAPQTASLLFALAIGLGLELAAPPFLLAQAPPPGPLDTSGVALFWATADRLAAGDSLTDADWDAFFAHAGYAVTESSGQRASVIRHCMPAAFHPAGDLEHARANPSEGEGRQALVERLCDHMASIRAQRPELEAYTASLEGLDLLADARRAASRYLPDGVVDRVPTPTAYVLLFEAQGFGRDGVIVLDGLVMMTQPRDQTVEFIAHELHHAYRDSFAEVDPAPDAAPAGVCARRDRERGLGIDARQGRLRAHRTHSRGVSPGLPGTGGSRPRAARGRRPRAFRPHPHPRGVRSGRPGGPEPEPLGRTPQWHLHGHGH